MLRLVRDEVEPCDKIDERSDVEAEAEADVDAEPDAREFRDGGFVREMCDGGGT